MYNRYCPKCGSINIIDDDVFDIDYQWEHDKIIAKVSATCTDCLTPITYKTHFKFDKYSKDVISQKLELQVPFPIFT